MYNNYLKLNFSNLVLVDFASYNPRDFKKVRKELVSYNKNTNKQFKPIFKSQGINEGYSGLKLNKYVRNQINNGDAMSLNIYDEVQKLPKSKANELIKLEANNLLNKGKMTSTEVALCKSYLSKYY